MAEFSDTTTPITISSPTGDSQGNQGSIGTSVKGLISTNSSSMVEGFDVNHSVRFTSPATSQQSGDEVSEGVEDVKKLTSEPRCPLVIQNEAKTEDDEVYRPLTIVKCHLDLLKLTQDVTEDSHSHDCEPTSEGSSDGNMDAPKTPEAEFQANTLENAAKIITQNAIESAIAAIRKDNSKISSPSNQQIDSQGNENRGTAMNKIHLLKLWRVLTSDESVNTRSEAQTEIVKEEGCQRVDNIDRWQCGDVVSFHTDGGSTSKACASEGTNAVKISYIEKDIDLSKANDMHTTASQLTNDEPQNCGTLPIITLTNVEGLVELLIGRFAPSAALESKNLPAAEENCPCPSPNLSLENQSTALSQESLGKDDTLDSASASISKLAHKSNTEAMQIISDHTEFLSALSKDPEHKDDTSDKCSLHSRQSTASLHVNSSELSMSVEQNASKYSTGNLTASERNSISTPENLVGVDVSNKTFEVNKVEINIYAEAKKELNVEKKTDNMAKDLTTHDGGISIDNKICGVAQSNMETVIELPTRSDENVSYSDEEDDDEFLLAEAESAFFAEFPDTNQQLSTLPDCNIPLNKDTSSDCKGCDDMQLQNVGAAWSFEQTNQGQPTCKVAKHANSDLNYSDVENALQVASAIVSQLDLKLISNEEVSSSSDLISTSECTRAEIGSLPSSLKEMSIQTEECPIISALSVQPHSLVLEDIPKHSQQTTSPAGDCEIVLINEGAASDTLLSGVENPKVCQHPSNQSEIVLENALDAVPTSAEPNISDNMAKATQIKEPQMTYIPPVKSKPITSEWVAAKPFQPRAQNAAFGTLPAYGAERPCQEGGAQYFNNNNCHSRSQDKKQIVSKGSGVRHEYGDNSDTLEQSAEDNSQDDVLDIIVLPDQLAKPPPPTPQQQSANKHGASTRGSHTTPFFRPPPVPRMYAPPFMMNRPHYHPSHYNRFPPPNFHPPQPGHPMQGFRPPHGLGYHRPLLRLPPNHLRFPRHPHPMMNPPPMRLPHAPRTPPPAVPPPSVNQQPIQFSPRFSVPPPPCPPSLHQSIDPLVTESPLTGFQPSSKDVVNPPKLCNVRDSNVLYQEIDGCCYFVPSYIPDKAMPGVQYGYSLRGNRRKTERLSSRFTTQAGKFRYHPNFYVRSCAELNKSNISRGETEANGDGAGMGNPTR